MKRTITLILIIITLAATAASAADNGEERTPLQGLDKIEAIVYGSPGSGGMLLRLAKIERDLFGMELPGSLTERQQALDAFVEKGSYNQPSLLFKANVAEWVTMRHTNSRMSLVERIETLEKTLEGAIQEGALSARLERLVTKLMPNGITGSSLSIPAGTVFKAKFAETLTVRNVEKGDIIELEVAEDLIMDGTLASAQGNRLFAEITKVKMPRSFGRPSEIGVEFVDVEFMDGKVVHVFIGPEAKKAMEVDSATIGAVGTSFLGAVVFGPVGLAGGFLVRGSDKQIKEGTLVYVETSDPVDITGYSLPNHVLDSIAAEDSAAPTESDSTTTDTVIE